MKKCKPVSEIVRSIQASIYGDIMESAIRAEYCESKGGCRFFPNGQQDSPILARGCRPRHGSSRTSKRTTPKSMSTRSSASSTRQSRGWKKEQRSRPDDRRPRPEGVLRNQAELKERGSRRANKVLGLEAFFGINELPYRPGTQFKPDKRVTIHRSTLGLVQIEVSIHFFALEDGLIVYEVCTELKFKVPVVDPVVVEAAELALIVLLVALFPKVSLPLWCPS